MNAPVLEILHTGLSASLQDLGRPGWLRYGVPHGGAMDPHAAAWANDLLKNPPGACVLETLLHGLRLRALDDVWICATGAVEGAPAWRPARLSRGDEFRLAPAPCGLWSYLAVEGGIAAESYLGSSGTYPRAGFGTVLHPGDVVHRGDAPRFELPRHTASVSAHWSEQRNYGNPPTIRLWPGPQLEWFSDEDIVALTQTEWKTSQHSDRVGYRLEGRRLHPAGEQLLSEPVLPGSIQVPPSGEPIVTMRDGPTVGGYPKIAMVDPASLSWLAQCRPGTPFRFTWDPGVADYES
jgi:antagonist of KipI